MPDRVAGSAGAGAGGDRAARAAASPVVACEGVAVA